MQRTIYRRRIVSMYEKEKENYTIKYNKDEIEYENKIY